MQDQQNKKPIEPVFYDVEDTPLFRHKVNELEANARKLRDRCSHLLSGFRRYKDSIAAMSRSQAEFANVLHEFFVGSDGDTPIAAGMPLTKFVYAFKEVASYYDLLKIKMDFMSDQLQTAWVDGLLSSTRDSYKQYERRQNDMEDAQHKYLSLRKVTKKEVIERAQQDLAAAKVFSEEARFDVARKMTEMEMRRHPELLQGLVDNINSHLRTFGQAVDVMRKLEPGLLQLNETITSMKQEYEEQQKQLELAIQRCKELSQHAKAAEVKAALEEAGPSTGPVQMSASKHDLNAEIEEKIRATQISNGAVVSILLQGYLYKRSTGVGAKLVDYKRRFFVLDSQGLLYYYSQKDTLFNKLTGPQKHTPQNTVSLLTSTVKMDDEEGSMRFCFRIVSPEGTYTLQAGNDAERRQWVDTIQAVINCLLNTVKDIDLPPRRGSVTTTRHRHTNSRTALPDFDTALLLHNSVVAAAAGAGITGNPFMPPGRSLDPTPSGSPSVRASETGGGQNPLSPEASNSNMPGQAEMPGPLERLRQVPGNCFCVDCGAPNPDWASLNLAVLMCIECSGIHRQLGVHVSKVRSCTLDVKVWEPTLIELFEAVGNEFANSIWEAQREAAEAVAAAATTATAAQRPAGKVDDSWVWCEDDEEDGASSSGPHSAVSRHVLVEGSQLLARKPGVKTPLPEKQRFITEKYVSRRWAEPFEPNKAALLLWEAVEAQDVRGAVRALAGGADIQTVQRHPKAATLVSRAHGLSGAAGGAGNATSRPGSGSGAGSGGATALHFAASQGSVVVAEFLLQNGASWEITDIFGRTALHYTILFDNSQVAKLLLKRGASASTRDQFGATAFDMAVHKGRVTDEELFLMLASASHGS